MRLVGVSPDFVAFARDQEWFHAIEIDGYVTRGRFRDGEVQNRTLLPVFEMLKNTSVRGLDCLDIGTVDGLTAFALKSLGARSVVATDRVERASFLRVREALGLDVEYMPGIELETMLEAFGERRFDLVVCAGVIYHMLNPFSAFQICRRLMRPGALFVVESAADIHRRTPALVLNSEAQLLAETYTYWVPSPAAVDGMLRLAGFDVLDRRELRSPDRYSAVGRAMRLSAIRDRTPLLRAMHEKGFVDHGFDIRALADGDASDRAVPYTVRDVPAVMSRERQAQLEFPLHPTGHQRTGATHVLGKRTADTNLRSSLPSWLRRSRQLARQLRARWLS